MTNIPTLFDPPITRKTDPETSHIAAIKLINSGRRMSQKDKILKRLRAGPATNVELAQLSLKYTGRISDLRHDGYKIICEQSSDNGVTEYRLVVGENG